MKNGRLAQALARFMAGRYGTDQLARFISCVSLVCITLSILTRSVGNGGISNLFFYLCMALLIVCYFRVFSRDHSRRRRENEFYLDKKYRLTSRLKLHRECFRQRRDYAFYRCPGCHQLVRVPRGKGKLRITCRRCGYSFEKKT